MEVKSKPTFPKSSFLDDTSPDETTITPTTILGWNKFVSSPVSSFFFFAERYVSAASKAATRKKQKEKNRVCKVKNGYVS